MRENYTDPEPDQKPISVIEAEEAERRQRAASHFQELELKRLKARDVVEFEPPVRGERKWWVK